jgi:hypothetical protein
LIEVIAGLRATEWSCHRSAAAIPKWIDLVPIWAHSRDAPHDAMMIVSGGSMSRQMRYRFSRLSRLAYIGHRPFCVPVSGYDPTVNHKIGVLADRLAKICRRAR